jgi:hypothetical protein
LIVSVIFYHYGNTAIPLCLLILLTPCVCSLLIKKKRLMFLQPLTLVVLFTIKYTLRSVEGQARSAVSQRRAGTMVALAKEGAPSNATCSIPVGGGNGTMSSPMAAGGNGGFTSRDIAIGMSSNDSPTNGGWMTTNDKKQNGSSSLRAGQSNGRVLGLGNSHVRRASNPMIGLQSASSLSSLHNSNPVTTAGGTTCISPDSMALPLSMAPPLTTQLSSGSGGGGGGGNSGSDQSNGSSPLSMTRRPSRITILTTTTPTHAMEGTGLTPTSATSGSGGSASVALSSPSSGPNNGALILRAHSPLQHASSPHLHRPPVGSVTHSSRASYGGIGSGVEYGALSTVEPSPPASSLSTLTIATVPGTHQRTTSGHSQHHSGGGHGSYTMMTIEANHDVPMNFSMSGSSPSGSVPNSPTPPAAPVTVTITADSGYSSSGSHTGGGGGSTGNLTSPLPTPLGLSISSLHSGDSPTPSPIPISSSSSSLPQPPMVPSSISPLHGVAPTSSPTSAGLALSVAFAGAGRRASRSMVRVSPSSTPGMMPGLMPTAPQHQQHISHQRSPSSLLAQQQQQPHHS